MANSNTSRPVQSHYTNGIGRHQSSPSDDLVDGISDSRGSHGPNKNASDMKIRSHREQLTQSPPASPRSTASSVTGETTQMRLPMPRTSSIDSAVSSISSNAIHSPKSSMDGGIYDAGEIRNLITTAGSAENLVKHLLKEKQYASSQNAQLWKLVDKQRSLLLNLNKDLERVARDKDRYKRKLKEIQVQATLLPKLLGREGRESPVPSDGGPPTAIPKNVKHDMKVRELEENMGTPDRKPILHAGSSPMDPGMLPSPLHLLQAQPEMQAQLIPRSFASHKTSMTYSNNPRSDLPPVMDTQSSPNSYPSTSSSIDRDSPRQAQDLEALQSLAIPPSVSVTEATPVFEKPDKAFPASRKAPPAPLNLGHARNASFQSQTLDPEAHPESGSDEFSKDEETPTHEPRGRRKTREDDDRDRELAAQKEQEARSRSKKQVSKSDLKADNGTAKAPSDVPIASVVSSSGQAVPHMPPKNADSARVAPAQSMAVALPLSLHEGSSISERLIAAAPLSPGLPMSPRPADRPPGSAVPRIRRDNLASVASPPMSPRGIISGLPLSPRAPRQLIPLPPNTPLSMAPPWPVQINAPQPFSPLYPQVPIKPVSTDTGDGQSNSNNLPSSCQSSAHAYNGLMDDAYPNLLLPPNALPSIDVKVASSRLQPSRGSSVPSKQQEEDLVFILSVISRFNNQELWRLEKPLLSLPQLDQAIKSVSTFSAKLPERKLFNGHSPATVDARRSALNAYFGDLLETPVEETAALVVCQFLSTDAVELRDDENRVLAGQNSSSYTFDSGMDGKPRKDGFLTKRGKNFGGWKARFFVLQGREFRYFETPGGPHLGTIKLHHAQIGKQSDDLSHSPHDDDDENQYRHAFLILEPKRKDSASKVRHVLCAESDQERDEWVEAILHHIDSPSDDEALRRSASKRFEDGKSHITGFEAKMKMYAPDHRSPGDGQRGLRSINYEETLLGTAPTTATPASHKRKDEDPSPTSASSDQSSGSHFPKSISGPINATVIQDAGQWGNKLTPGPSKDNRKRGLWNFRQRSSSDLVLQSQAHSSEMSTNSTPRTTSTERKSLVRAVFGLPLAEAVEHCSPVGADVELPAVVYRCIEYLRAKNAASEEGIFRLSGSNVVVRTLRDRFNAEGDVDFLRDGQYYDVHAVASLFKSYLRELPVTVLTRDLHLEFLRVLELDDKSNKVNAFNSLVHQLPSVNLSLLKALSQYLIEVVNSSDKNKMNVRNVGIVFSPTLNIPAPVFSMFLTDFGAIFERDAISDTRTRVVEVSMPQSLTMDDIRSPRHQIFSNLPTPAYHQTTFGREAAQTPSSTRQDSAAAPPFASSSYDTGFIPIQPSYETRNYVSDPHTPLQPQHRLPLHQQQPSRVEYGSMNSMMAPLNAPTEKAKRRESSMLFMGLSHHKSTQGV